MRRFFLYLMAFLYILAGINHFLQPEFYKKIMPPWLLWHLPLIYITGAFEIIFAFLLLVPVTRKQAAWCLIILLVVIFPANVQMMVNYLQENNPRLWMSILRLPLQMLLIWWAYQYTKPMSGSTPAP